MSFIGGLLAGGLLGAYWTRPGGWLSGIYGGTRPMPSTYYYGPTYSTPVQYRYLPQYPQTTYQIPQPQSYYLGYGQPQYYGYQHPQYYGYRQLPYGYYY